MKSVRSSLAHGARECRKPGIVAAFEEGSQRIVANADGSGWIAARVFGAVALLVLALGCSGSKTTSGQPLKLSIAEASQPVFALLYVADAKGFLREAGLDVTFKSFALGRDALKSVLEGKSDLATVYETPVVSRIYEGKDLAIISTLHRSTRNNAVLARPDRGITTPGDLRGKKIGLSLGTSQEYLLSVLLVIEGIPADGVTRVQVEPADYEKALLEGAVDAVTTIDPYGLRRVLGNRGVIFFVDAYTETSMLVGMREVIAGKREAMMRLAGALVKAQDYLERDREGSINLVVARLASRFDERSIRDTWDNLKLEAKLDNVLLATMLLEAQWMKDAGKFTGAIPDFRKSIVADYLQAANPAHVTLQHFTAR